ncbi:MAG: hypothetical protein ACREIW_02975 [Chthoniobacterales bacterium]
MKLDDSKLTAFALDELDEPDRSAMAQAVAESPEAQRFVAETREMARALEREFAVEQSEGVVLLSRNDDFPAVDHTQPRTGDRRSLVDIPEEPWFWSRARPLALAAAVAIFAILGAIVFGNFKSRQDSSIVSSGRLSEIEAEERAPNEIPPEPVRSNAIPNPLRHDVVQRIERVVIGEFDVDPRLQNGEMHVIETIKDAYRIERLKERLATPTLSKKSRPGTDRHGYELMFLDRNGQIIASATFYRSGGSEFVLQPTKYGSAIRGHYFPDRSDTLLPGNWESGVDYLGYAIPFPDWGECIGYAPGV